MPNPWLSMTLVLGLLALMVAVLRLYQQLGSPHPELVRKLLHMGMGALTLAFPWLFDRAWPIVVLVVLSVTAMLAMRLVGRLRCGVGSVVTGVSRMSLGEVYFPVSVAVLFLLFLHDTEPDPARRTLSYCIPILLLTLADALAALVGVRYGQAHYATSDGRKSLEGSLAFFLVAFLCVHIPLILFDDGVKPRNSLLIALLLAWLAMMFEAISWAGLDNLALPLVSYLLLQIYLPLNAEQLGMRLLVTAGFTLFAVLCRQRSTLIGSAVCGVALVGYISWALGGWDWVVPPFILFATYTFLSPRTEANSQHVHNIHAVVCVSSAGLIWLFVWRILERPDLRPLFYFLFTLSFAAHLAIIGLARLGFDYPRMTTLGLVLVCIAKAWLFVFWPYVLLRWGEPGLTLDVGVGLVGVALAAVGFVLLQPDVRNCAADTPRWLRQAGCAAAGSALGLLPLFLR